MIFAHTCVLCGSPCEMTLATSSENCTNPKCRVYAPSLKVLEKPEPVKAPPGLVVVPKFNEDVQREARGLMRDQLRDLRDPVSFMLTQPCVCCQAKALHVVPMSDRKKLLCQACRMVYTDISVENTIHDEFKLVFRIHRPMESIKTNVSTGRLSSKGPNFSNIPRGAYDGIHPSAQDEEVKTLMPSTTEEGKAYEEKRLRWPNTMRVLDRSTLKEEPPLKDGLPIIGVLSLCDVDLTGDRAAYDYVALQSHNKIGMRSVRMRVEAYKHGLRKPRLEELEDFETYHKLIGDKGYFDVRIIKQYGTAEGFTYSKHVLAIMIEFEKDNLRKRSSRLPTCAERYWFRHLKK